MDGGINKRDVECSEPYAEAGLDAAGMKGNSLHNNMSKDQFWHGDTCA